MSAGPCSTPMSFSFSTKAAARFATPGNAHTMLDAMHPRGPAPTSQAATACLGMLCGLLLTPGMQTALGDEPAPPSASFSRDVAPLLVEHCLACHNPRKAEGGYRVDTFESLGTAGDSGLLPLVGEDGEPAELIRRITSHDESERMPAETAALGDAAVAVLTQWVAAGASFDAPDPSMPLQQVIPPPQHPAAPAAYPAALPVTAVAFSPDGTQLYTSGYHEVLVWNLDGSLAHRIGNVGERVYALAVSPDGQTLAVGCGQPGREGEVRFVSLTGGNADEVRLVPVRLDDVVLDLAYRPDGAAVAAACADKTVRLIDAASGELMLASQSHAEQVTAVSFSGDGGRLASASRDGSAKVFDASSGELLVSYQGHTGPVRGVALLADGSQAFSTGDDKQLHRWNVGDAKKVADVGLGGAGFRLALSPDAIWLPAADGRLRRISLADNAVKEFQAPADWLLCTAVSPDGSRIATGSHDGTIQLWNTADAASVTRWQAQPNEPVALRAAAQKSAEIGSPSANSW